MAPLLASAWLAAKVGATVTILDSSVPSIRGIVIAKQIKEATPCVLGQSAL
jgi:hypothetical protein